MNMLYKLVTILLLCCCTHSDAARRGRGQATPPPVSKPVTKPVTPPPPQPTLPQLQITQPSTDQKTLIQQVQTNMTGLTNNLAQQVNIKITQSYISAFTTQVQTQVQWLIDYINKPKTSAMESCPPCAAVACPAPTPTTDPEIAAATIQWLQQSFSFSTPTQVGVAGSAVANQLATIKTKLDAAVAKAQQPQAMESCPPCVATTCPIQKATTDKEIAAATMQWLQQSFGFTTPTQVGAAGPAVANQLTAIKAQLDTVTQKLQAVQKQLDAYNASVFAAAPSTGSTKPRPTVLL